MNSDNLRFMIDNAIQEEERTGSFEKLLARTPVTEEYRAALDTFFRSYITQVPDILDAAYAAADRANVLGGMQPIFNAAFNYWAAPDDLIPDRTGLFGLADDAYLSLHLMEVASNLHQQQSGQALLSIDLSEQNQWMRTFLGESVASQLDAIVAQTMAEQAIQVGLRQLAGFLGAFPLNVPGFFGGSSYADISREADIRLGAMGGPLPY